VSVTGALDEAAASLRKLTVGFESEEMPAWSPESAEAQGAGKSSWGGRATLNGSPRHEGSSRDFLFCFPELPDRCKEVHEFRSSPLVVALATLSPWDSSSVTLGTEELD
jgi:hypothetical protein